MSPVAVPPGNRIPALEHVAYECAALQRAWERHGGNPFAWTAWFVHARNVHDFFFEPGRQDDLVAEQFLPGWKPTCVAAVGLPSFKTAANKLTAHLTLSRLDYARGAGYAPSKDVTKYLVCCGTQFGAALTGAERAAFAAAHASELARLG